MSGPNCLDIIQTLSLSNVPYNRNISGAFVLGHLRPHTPPPPLRTISGEYPVFSECPKAAMKENLLYITILFRVCHPQTTKAVRRFSEEPLLAPWRKQLPIDPLPGDSGGDRPVCSVSCGEAPVGRQYSTSSFSVTTRRDAPESVLTTLCSSC